ncbi:MAG: adenine deaminase [Synergistetes bacterium]|nr:adenine deaminase [Synergistota bacterium]
MRISDILPVALGKLPADLLIKNARIVNVFSGEIEEGNVAIFRKRIAGIGDYREGKKVIDIKGAYLVPGLIDGHVHIESSMVDPIEFARAVLSRGTTTVIADPHEIANVAGLTGIEYMLYYTEGIPLNLYIMLPSCVPATKLETSGAEINIVDMIGFVEKHPRILGLGEVMNFPGVLAGDEGLIAKIELLRHKYKKIDGHAPGLSGKELNAYICAFIRSDHESTTAEEAKEKLARGMQVLVREGSVAKNLDALIPFITEMNYPYASFCTDDKHPGDMLEEGHIDYMVRRAIQKGIDPIIAIRMATINTARHYNLRSMGAIAPGYKADMVVTDSLEDFSPKLVIKDAQVVAREGRIVTEIVGNKYEIPKPIKNSFGCPEITLEDIRISATSNRVRAIRVFDESLLTKEEIVEVNFKSGYIEPDTEKDLLQIVVINRYRKEKELSHGFIRGTGLKRGAVATSVGHDSHNLCVIGSNQEDMVLAANTVIRHQGGLVVTVDQKVLEFIPLSIGGLMSTEKMEVVAEKINHMKEILKENGSLLDDLFMTVSFIQLPVIPEIRITDKGIVDARKGEFRSLFV